jgi:site-specific DNA recombinase
VIHIKAALYIRVSTQDQVENYSIETQKERLEALCKAKGWNVYEIYIDGGYSGGSTNRPALQQMLSELKNIDVVVVYKLDRLSRTQRDTLSLIEDHFLANKVEFVSMTETLDTSTPFGKAMIGILSVFAQLERETIAERMRMGHIKRAEEGLRGMGGNHDPSGYYRQDGQLVMNEEEARHIQLVYDLYEQYHSITKIQTRLKELGEPVWRFRRYRDILSNKLYCGYVSFAEEYYKGQHEPIIAEGQFERVQILLGRHKGHNAHKAKQSLFSGLLICGNCGESYMTYQTKNHKKNTVYKYYICRARRFPSEYEKKCMNKTWNHKNIEELVIDELKTLPIDKNASKSEEKQVNYKSMLKKVDEKMERILNLYADGSIEKTLLDKQIAKLDEEKRRLHEAKARQDEISKTAITRRMLEQFAIDITKSDFNEKQAILHKLVNHIVINGESITIEWIF